MTLKYPEAFWNLILKNIVSKLHSATRISYETDFWVVEAKFWNYFCTTCVELTGVYFVEQMYLESHWFIVSRRMLDIYIEKIMLVISPKEFKISFWQQHD